MEIDEYDKEFSVSFWGPLGPQKILGFFDQLRGNESELKGQIKYYSPKSAE